ncbi:FCD domain-containing protein [Microbacterium keratanolyticum]
MPKASREGLTKSARAIGEEHFSRESIAVLEIVGASSVPRGARHVARLLQEAGYTISEPTVSRLLTRLDESGMTIGAGSKGRVLTERGRALLTEILRNRSRGEELSGALNIQHIDQLLDLLRARRGLEREVIVLAVERATEEDLNDLEDALHDHRHMMSGGSYEGYVANRFHKILVRCTGSALFEALSTVVLYEALDALDPLLLVVTSLHGTVSDAPDEHRALLEALRQRDAPRAQALLDEHLSRLISEVEDFKKNDNDGVFSSLLSLAQGASS